jgi:hypothetical protein
VFRLPGRLDNHGPAVLGCTSLSVGQDDGAQPELATQVCMPALEAQLGVDRSRGHHTPGVRVQQREYLLSWIQQGGGRETEILKFCGTDGGRGYRHAMGDKQSATSWGNHDRFRFSDPLFHGSSLSTSSSGVGSSSKVFTPRSPIVYFQ